MIRVNADKHSKNQLWNRWSDFIHIFKGLLKMTQKDQKSDQNIPT
jgi:hypothetical protein